MGELASPAGDVDRLGVRRFVQRLAWNTLLELEPRGTLDMMTILRGRKTLASVAVSRAAFALNG